MIVIEDIDYIGVTVSDMDNAISFYSDLFDFEVIERVSNTDEAYIRVGDILLKLVEVKDFKAPENLKNNICFYIDEEDFDDALDELQEKNITIVYGPENIRKGRLVVFTDPDGNKIELRYPRFSL
ncbi:MAG TPA: VOC family protein [Spirochaetota bacterium]|nr:VOC family protein [Spirochaetota bacterium]HOM87674.1 VOC family protein [Spirochaetota bacterium]HOR94073.1 VOC family protein [Spirochaetota bacterium]HOT19040.1 VOC family protein [Spirochaetota bacterium]HPD04673.1 VOC family protein [Spirochaetota bacterium]